MEKSEPKERELFLSTIDGYLRQDLNQMALDLANARLHRFPTDVDAKMALCNIFMKMGKVDEAKEILRELEDLLAGLSKIYACMGDDYLKKGLKQEAISLYRKFISLNPNSGMAEEINKKINSLVSTQDNNFKDSGDKEEDVRDVGIGNIAPHFHTVTMAEIYMKQDLFEMAASILREILKKDANNKIAAEKLREIKLKLNNRGKVNTRKNAAKVIGELERWLTNIDRMRNYAS